MAEETRLAIFISGGGSTMAAIMDACQDGRLTGIKPVLVISSRPDAGGIQKARDRGILDKDILVLEKRAFGSTEAFGEAILHACQTRKVDLIGQYGWLPFTPVNVITAFPHKIVNQHPGPLQGMWPCFGGRGMFGRRVHCARLQFVRTVKRDFWTSVVAHFLTTDDAYDQGAVFHMEEVEIQPDDDPVSLAARALSVEHRVQIEALRMLAAGTTLPIHYRDRLVRDDEVEILENAKRTAALLFPHG